MGDGNRFPKGDGMEVPKGDGMEGVLGVWLCWNKLGGMICEICNSTMILFTV